MQHVRYVRATPAPKAMPRQILRNVEFVEK
jgi:hypothetical protein